MLVILNSPSQWKAALIIVICFNDLSVIWFLSLTNLLVVYFSEKCEVYEASCNIFLALKFGCIIVKDPYYILSAIHLKIYVE